MRQFNNIFRVAIRSILKNRMRSLLTSLGIIIGVSAVIVMVAIGSGSQKQIENQLGSMGTNMLVVFPSWSQAGGVSRGAGSRNRFTLKDVELIEQKQTLLSGVSPMINSNAQIVGGSGNWATSINGVSADYLDIRSWPLASGQFFTSADLRSRKKVAVIGKTIADQLFADTDPIGQQIRIRNTPFVIVGVLSSKGQNPMGRDQDDIILAPSTTVLYRLKGGEHVDMIYTSAINADQMTVAQEEVETLMREAHNIKPGQDDDFMVRNQAELIETATATAKVMTTLLGSIAGVSLIVGGIGIMNIMLVSVTERTREIGIRLSVGARSSDILTQFLVEAIVLSCTGGIIGVALAFGIAAVMEKLSPVAVLIEPSIVMLAFSFAALIGIFFGFYPARKAAMLNPIDAVRHQ